jgi:hypothetical protein
MTFIQTSNVAPVCAAGVSCAIGFNLHDFLSYTGQIVGILSGFASIGWVLYQAYRSSKQKQ